MMHKPVVIAVPVNLRKYFPSVSARNFFSIVNIGRTIDPINPPEIKDLAVWFGKELARQTTLENMSADINAYAGAESHPLARITPLPIKNIVLRYAYMNAQEKASATLSNVGVLRLPSEVERYVRSFSVCNATNKIQACVCSFRDVLSVTFTSPYVSSTSSVCFSARSPIWESTLKSAQTGLISYLTDDKAYLKHIKWENSTRAQSAFAITTLLFMLSACQNTAEPEQTASVAKIDTFPLPRALPKPKHPAKAAKETASTIL